MPSRVWVQVLAVLLHVDHASQVVLDQGQGQGTRGGETGGGRPEDVILASARILRTEGDGVTLLMNSETSGRRGKMVGRCGIAIGCINPEDAACSQSVRERGVHHSLVPGCRNQIAIAKQRKKVRESLGWSHA